MSNCLSYNNLTIAVIKHENGYHISQLPRWEYLTMVFNPDIKHPLKWVNEILVGDLGISRQNAQHLLSDGNGVFWDYDTIHKRLQIFPVEKVIDHFDINSPGPSTSKRMELIIENATQEQLFMHLHESIRSRLNLLSVETMSKLFGIPERTIQYYISKNGIVRYNNFLIIEECDKYESKVIISNEGYGDAYRFSTYRITNNSGGMRTISGIFKQLPNSFEGKGNDPEYYDKEYIGCSDSDKVQIWDNLPHTLHPNTPYKKKGEENYGEIGRFWEIPI